MPDAPLDRSVKVRPLPPPDPQTPIVPDAEFNAALPPLSGDINAPLEPMPPASAPQTVIDQNAPFTPQAVLDPELAQPLAPLGTFSTTPPADIADAGPKTGAEIRYDTVVNGLDVLGLTGRFNALSALRKGKGKAANSAQVNARAREDEALAIKLMKSLGYYDGTAVSTIETVANDPGRVRAVVNAAPGQLYRLGSVAADSEPVVPATLITDNLPLRTGDPIEADRIQGAEANVSLQLPENGYPFVKLGMRDILLDENSLTGDYTLPLDPGPRSSFGAISTVASAGGKLAFDVDHVRVLPRFATGELYKASLVDDLRKALVATGLFETVSVEPVRTGRPGPDGTEIVDLLVTQTEGKTRSVAGTAGYSTGQGLRADVTYTARNAFRPEGALIVGLVGGTQEQGAALTFRRSNAGKRDRTVTLTASADHASYDAYSAFTGTIAGRISYDSTPIWQKRFTYGYGFELTGTNESVYDFGLRDRRRGTYFIVALPLQAAFDTSDNLLNPTRGYRLKLSLSPETSVRGKASPYARALIEGSIYYPVSNSLVIAGRARAGSIVGISRDDLAPSRRYYGGGGGSVRGYGYQRLGPFDPDGDPVGGRSVNEFALEARYRFGNFGIVPFFDAGNSYESSYPRLSDLRYGAGIGGRLYTNFGPLRIDVATPLNKRKGDSRIALYISIGQAF
ncbi:autotransporter assembly complex family protein [uncultured Sphingomonas sp.]|uniref:autotransporter assembly complex protein TamA n=1 Tax=uncultured Sphingomonas sp. TaxID=158754 RepID=UPI0035C95307